MVKTVVLKDMADVPGVQITMYSSKDRAIKVEYQGKNYKFKECQDGLYYYDTAFDNSISGATNKSNAPMTPYLFLITVEDNKSYFSSNESEAANSARKVQQIIGWDSTDNFKSIIKKQLIKNCNVTIDDINRAKLIYGPENLLLKGEITR